MEGFVLVLLGLLALALLVGFLLVGIYNRIIRLRNRFKNAYSQIDVQLQRRYDLIPNLIETAKAYMSHEQQTLQAVVEARNLAQKASLEAQTNPADNQLLNKLANAEKQLTTQMKGFYAVMENYPDLKASATMRELMESLQSTENKVSFARQHFNDSVMEYNIAIQEFPNTLVASTFHFTETQQLELQDDAAKQAIKVSFPS